ncbi:ATP-binding protein [Streptomyces sp. VRA16 Mangrove soil]|uniref:ATP-binding protein n=1 Tax=Streptomyces sp. VRA16 Mangrove soil TaxID=2817434 RepID=UPI001AA00540|nr:ATP-binding protein [Streptomyces sp. VRA16 Mangrove soil]MBO1330271.1 ATP-binding protein [Streptomyces sp. VRA16 Mangrove soil]
MPISSGVKTARDWTRDHLQDLGWPATSPDTVDAVLLTVSELVTNTHVHARSTAQLILTWDGDCLHVTVHDNDPAPPRPRAAGTEETGGRGLLLIDALADTWQAHRCPRGKDVTACFRPRPREGDR